MSNRYIVTISNNLEKRLRKLEMRGRIETVLTESKRIEQIAIPRPPKKATGHYFSENSQKENH